MTAPHNIADYGIKPGEVRNPRGAIRQFTRKDVRKMLVAEVVDAIPQLREWIRGRARILVGFKNYEELAERFHEIYERNLDPSADRVPPWETLPQERKDLLIDTFRTITGGKLTLRQIAINVGAQQQSIALELAMKYGLGSQQSLVDDEGNTVPGVVYLPPPDIQRSIEEHNARQARALVAGPEAAEDVEYEIVVEDVMTEQARAAKGEEQKIEPVEERVNPALVELVRHKFKPTNGKGKNGTE